MVAKFSVLQRRQFLKGCAAAAAGSLVSRGRFLAGAPAFGEQTSPSAFAESVDLTGAVNPMIGTGWHGHMFPGALAPFGLVQLSPDTSGPPEVAWNGEGNTYGWDHCSGYHYPDNVILGFSHTHLQGTGADDLGDVLLMPLAEGRNWSWNRGVPGQQAETQIEAIGPDSGWVLNDGETGYFSFFRHDQEVVRPGYYAVHLSTPDVQAELTATTRCGMHRYGSSGAAGSGKRGLMLDLVHGIGCTVYAAELHVESATRVTGSRSTHGWAADKQVYFVLELSRPALSMKVKVDGAVKTAAPGAQFSGKELQAIFTDAASEEPLVVRVGISGTSIEGARKNLEAEIPHWDFDAVKSQTGKAWSEALAVLDVELADAGVRQTFYTGAYHGLVAPATFNDVDGTYRGQDHRNHANPGFTKYTTLSIWDIYRGEFPFVMLMQPHRTGDIVRTLLADYDQLGQHSLPVWPLWGNETWCMTGFHVVGMIAGAYARGLRDFDVDAAWTAMRDTALTGATINQNKQLQEEFRHYGYVPSGTQKQSVSRTLDFAYDYWCVGAMAEMLGKQDDAAMFYKLGQNYKNLFDRASGFMRGKTEQGQFREPFRPDEEFWEDYTESDAWQATFNVMQDVQGLIDLYGGDEPFMAKLDALFAAPSNILHSPPDVSGLVGQDAQGNEPSNHIPYLYCFAGAPWKTQQAVRRVMRLYNNTPAGIPGNDDCGQISTWLVMSALGFYPVNAVTGVYIIGSPLVQRARIHNPANGTTFSIVADDNSPENAFIQSAELNGKELTRCWFTHADIVSGGELHLRMGSRPDKEWGAARADRPPSGLVMKRS
ncbi:MAG TPA: GH92 family glycosyl hydrolase [Acidobacteriaceae bacterium]|jgi:predicted alpha-1,2-mannosidase|nr:GH92 family glycosyl hydrolase [Acidobacteriaceae bacterium]